MKRKRISKISVVPSLQCTEADCGSSCFLSILSTFYKKRPIYKTVTRSEVVIRTQNTEEGMDVEGIKSAAKFFNLSINEFTDGSLEKLKKYLNSGRPILCHILMSAKHWIIVVSISKDGKTITVMDPNYFTPVKPDVCPGIRTFSSDKFLEYWNVKDEDTGEYEHYGIAFGLGKQHKSVYKKKGEVSA